MKKNFIYNVSENISDDDTIDLDVTCYVNPLDPSEGKEEIKYKAITEEKYLELLNCKELLEHLLSYNSDSIDEYSER